MDSPTPKPAIRALTRRRSLLLRGRGRRCDAMESWGTPASPTTTLHRTVLDFADLGARRDRARAPRRMAGDLAVRTAAEKIGAWIAVMDVDSWAAADHESTTSSHLSERRARPNEPQGIVLSHNNTPTSLFVLTDVHGLALRRRNGPAGDGAAPTDADGQPEGRRRRADSARSCRDPQSSKLTAPTARSRCRLLVAARGELRRR